MLVSKTKNDSFKKKNNNNRIKNILITIMQWHKFSIPFVNTYIFIIENLTLIAFLI